MQTRIIDGDFVKEWRIYPYHSPDEPIHPFDGYIAFVKPHLDESFIRVNMSLDSLSPERAEQLSAGLTEAVRIAKEETS